MDFWIYIPEHVGALIFEYAGIYPDSVNFEFNQPIPSPESIPLPYHLSEIICDYVISPEQVFARCVLETFYNEDGMDYLETIFPGFITEEIEDRICYRGRECTYDHRALFKYNSWFVSMSFVWEGRADSIPCAHWTINFPCTEDLHYKCSPMDVVDKCFRFTRKLDKFEWASQNLREIDPMIKLFSDDEITTYIKRRRINNSN